LPSLVSNQGSRPNRICMTKKKRAHGAERHRKAVGRLGIDPAEIGGLPADPVKNRTSKCRDRYCSH